MKEKSFRYREDFSIPLVEWRGNRFNKNPYVRGSYLDIHYSLFIHREWSSLFSASDSSVFISISSVRSGSIITCCGCCAAMTNQSLLKSYECAALNLTSRIWQMSNIASFIVSFFFASSVSCVASSNSIAIMILPVRSVMTKSTCFALILFD